MEVKVHWLKIPRNVSFLVLDFVSKLHFGDFGSEMDFGSKLHFGDFGSENPFWINLNQNFILDQNFNFDQIFILDQSFRFSKTR